MPRKKVPETLGKRILMGLFHGGCRTWEDRMVLRNEAISLYFKTRAVRMDDKEIVYEPDDSEAVEAHKWYGGLLNVIRRASGEFNAEVDAAQRYLETKPETATV